MPGVFLVSDGDVRIQNIELQRGENYDEYCGHNEEAQEAGFGCIRPFEKATKLCAVAVEANDEENFGDNVRLEQTFLNSWTHRHSRCR